jgi:hypothetical protein
MAELDLQTAAEAVDYINSEILTKLPTNIDQFTPENVDDLIGRLYVLRYYCLKKGFGTQITSRLDNLIETCQGLLDLLDTNANTFMYLKEMYKIRGLDLTANLIGQFEELSSGEDTIRDVIVNAIGTYLFWKSDTIWVDVAKIDHFSPSKNHARRIRDELWRIINESENGDHASIEKASEIGENMNQLLEFMISDELPAAGRVLLLSNIYTLLLRLELDKTILAMGSDGK